MSVNQTNLTLPVQHQTIENNSTFISRIKQKIEDIVTRWAFSAQFTQIASRKELAKRHIKDLMQLEREFKILNEKEQALKNHIPNVSYSDKLAMILTSLKISPLRSIIVRYLIHPATGFLTLENQFKTSSSDDINLQYNDRRRRFVNDQILGGLADRVQIFTKDHILIDGCMVYSNPDDKVTKKPVMVMSQGNFATAEGCYDIARMYADKYNINVMLYNPRGVANSLGCEYNTDEAIEDCRAAIEHALKEYCTNANGEIIPGKLAVYGHSLGGGIAANALKELSRSGFIPKEGIGLYVNHHSFASIPAVISGTSKAALFFLNTLFWLLGINTLNALDLSVSTKNRLAQRIIVASAKMDEVISGVSQLAAQLRIKKTAHELKNLNITLIDINSYDHNEQAGYIKGIQLEKVERKRPDAESLFNHHTEINQWANSIITT